MKVCFCLHVLTLGLYTFSCSTCTPKTIQPAELLTDFTKLEDVFDEICVSVLSQIACGGARQCSVGLVRSEQSRMARPAVVTQHCLRHQWSVVDPRANQVVAGALHLEEARDCAAESELFLLSRQLRLHAPHLLRREPLA